MPGCSNPGLQWCIELCRAGTLTITHSSQQKAGFGHCSGWEIGKYGCCRQQNQEFSRWQPSLGVGVEPRRHVLLNPEMSWEEADAKEKLLPHKAKKPKVSFPRIPVAITSPVQAALLGAAAHQISSCHFSRARNCVVCAAQCCKWPKAWDSWGTRSSGCSNQDNISTLLLEHVATSKAPRLTRLKFYWKEIFVTAIPRD